MIRRARSLWREQAGQSAIEFSLIAVVFFMVMFGIVEMGRMVLVYTTVANCARAGTRYAIVHGADRTGSGANGPSGTGNVTQVQTVVKNFASAGLVNTSAMTVTVTYPSGNTTGSPVLVAVSYTYDPLIPFFNTLLHRTMGSTSEGIISF